MGVLLVRWERVSVSGFQSFQTQQTLDLDPVVTLIAGRNDVGKSALLRALRLGVESQRGAAETMTVAMTWLIDTAEIVRVLFADGSPLQDDEARLRRAIERPKAAQRLTATFRDDGISPDTNVGLGGLREISLDDVGIALSNGAWTTGPRERHGKGWNELLGLCQRLVRRVAYSLPRRPLQGAQVVTSEGSLAPDGANLTSVVNNMLASARLTTFAELESLIIEAFPDVRAIGFRPRADASPYQGELQVSYDDGRNVALTQCGTGIEQLLALGAAVLTLDQGRLILIDEPSSFLHPAAERVLIGFLRAHPGHQYVVATHSNVFLNAFPLDAARLLIKGSSGTVITSPESPGDILEELGLRAGDLWLSPRVVWVEGDSEVAALKALVNCGALDEVELGEVRALPNLSRFLGRKADAEFRVVEAIMGSVTELAVERRFVFDSDEKSELEKEAIRQTSGGTAVFLEVRELENCFLCPAAIAERLRGLTGDVDHPDEATIEDALNEQLTKVGETRLFPAGDPSGDPARSVRAHALLGNLYWEYATADYDKTAEAAVLAPLVWAKDPSLLAPLIEAISSSPTAPRADGPESE